MGTGAPSGQYAPVVVTGSRTKPSIWSGDTPASAIALRSARMLQAPTQVSGVPPQRRAVAGGPTRTAAPSAHTGVGCAVPARGRWRVSDTDSRDFAAMFPQPQSLSDAIHGSGRM